MSIFNSLGVVTLFWVTLFVGDQLLRRFLPSKSRYPECLENVGVTLSFANARCYTTKFNKLFHAAGKCSKSFCWAWFSLGAVTGILMMLLSVVVLVLTLYQAMTGPDDSSEQVLIPVMPGVNLPWSDIAYYLVTLVVCGVFHEMGHAFAATNEQVRVIGFGLFIFFLYPGAFVDLHTDQLTLLPLRRQLKIYCAGVWHNVILVLCALGVLATLPYLLAPFYTTGLGAVVTSVGRDSVLSGKLEPGAIITKVNNCPVYSPSDWESCVELVSVAPQTGYCVAEEVLSGRESFLENQTLLAEDGTRECCDRDSLSDICFHVFHALQQHSTYKCLTARVVSVRMTCSNYRDCKEILQHSCVFPAIAQPSKLVRISHTEGNDVLFLGDPRVLPLIIRTTAFNPYSPSVPLWLPNLVQTMCRYITSLSSALALLNMVPAFFLDGQWTLTALVDIFLEKKIPDAGKRNVICNCILATGSLLLILNVLLAMWTLIYW